MRNVPNVLMDAVNAETGVFIPAHSLMPSAEELIEAYNKKFCKPHNQDGPQPLVLTPWSHWFVCIEFDPDRSCWYNPSGRYYEHDNKCACAYLNIAYRLGIIEDQMTYLRKVNSLRSYK
jgi:hypothetical protein